MATVVMPYQVLEAHAMAVERVEQLLRMVTARLNEAGVPYAVIGGNAVAAWVATRDPDAVRTTKVVDLLANRADLSAIDAAAASIGYYLEMIGDAPVLLERANPRPKRGVQLVYAGEKYRASEPIAAPTLDRAVEFPEGFRVIGLPELLTMKLTAFRKHDQVHIEDMIQVGLISEDVRALVPESLKSRLEEIERGLRDRCGE